MKTALVLMMAAMLIFPSCKSKKMTAVEPVPAVQELREAPVTQPEPEELAEIPVRTERFTFEDREQEVTHDFFVIVGSYSIPENAERARAKLATQGFTPMILKSETGLNRLCVNSYVNESEARARVHQIRRTFPEYHDAWLLIRQK